MTPLHVDLDSALLRTDLLFESLARLLRQRPWMLVFVPFWALGGRAALARQIARRISLDVSTLAYQAPVLDWLRKEKRAGRRLVLVTSTNEAAARNIASYLAIFDEVRAGEKADPIDAFRTRRTWRDYAAALRVHQWAKNVLGFAPLITSHELFHPALVLRCTMAMGLFSLCSSAQYIFNDLVDLESDRRHPTKRLRPFASGNLPLQAGFLLAPLLLAIALTGAYLLNRDVLLTIGGYAIGALAYSLYFKKKVLLDVFVLSGLLLLRVIAGQLVTGVVYSVWLLTFAFFLLLSLGFSKRCTELSGAKPGSDGPAGRGYQAADLTQVNLFGVCSGFLAAVVFMLYLQSDRVRELYRSPELLWLLSPLFLYWISRVWILSSRGAVHEDPVMFVLKDRATWWVGGLAALIMALAGAKSWSGHTP